MLFSQQPPAQAATTLQFVGAFSSSDCPDDDEEQTQNQTLTSNSTSGGGGLVDYANNVTAATVTAFVNLTTSPYKVTFSVLDALKCR